MSRKSSEKKLTTREFYAYRLMWRNTNYNIILRVGRLMQQYVVDMYAKIEQLRLNFIRNNQAQLRAEQYQGLYDAILHGDAQNTGRKIILPATFHGGPRYMNKRYQDAMGIVRVYGKPTLFITFTCNPNWPEIENELLPNQIPSDRPDLTSRVFRLKLKELMNDLIITGVFGTVLDHLYVVEFQKRGLPHSHILLILDENGKLKTPDDYDKVVCAELPDPIKAPELFAIVTKHMIHNPCGIHGYNKSCMIDRKCTKQFPKQFCTETTDLSNGYPQYRRRSYDQGGNIFKKKIEKFNIFY